MSKKGPIWNRPTITMKVNNLPVRISMKNWSALWTNA